MASITIRDLDLAVKKQIKSLAVTHGRSMEAEARDILTDYGDSAFYYILICTLIN